MASSRGYVYWDTCTVLDYLKANPAWIGILTDLLDRSSNGTGDQIVTSTVTVAEVAYITDLFLDDASNDDLSVIDAFWADESAIKLIEFHQGIAREVRLVTRAAKRAGLTGLRSIDAVHFGSAIAIGASALHTTDEKILRFQPASSTRICHPHTSSPRLGNM